MMWAPCLKILLLYYIMISFELRKIKTKVIYLTNHNRRKQRNVPIRTRSQARENACEQVTIGLGFCFSLVEKVARTLLPNYRV